MRSIGLDVGKHFAEVAISEPGRGTRSGGRISASPEGLQAYAATLGPDDQVVLEATTNTWAIVELLEARGRSHRRPEDVVVHPRVEAAEWRQLDDFGVSDPLSGEAPWTSVHGPCNTRVGTRTAARTSLTLRSIAVRNDVNAAPGLRLRLMCHPNQSRKASFSAISGAHSAASRSRYSRAPQPARTSASRLRHCSGCVRPRVVVGTRTLDPRIEEH